MVPRFACVVHAESPAATERHFCVGRFLASRAISCVCLFPCICVCSDESVYVHVHRKGTKRMRRSRKEGICVCVRMYRFDDINITCRKCRGMNGKVAQRHTGDRTGSEQGTPPAQTA
jgi:hypothetical protein